MNITETQVFLNIIDSRIKKYINESKLLRQYMGTVVELTDTNAKCKVKLAGNDTIFTFLNKSGEILQVNDNVYIQTVGTDLNTGIITQKTKEDNNIVDYIIEQNIYKDYGQWSYRKWNSGVIEAWGKFIFKIKDMVYDSNKKAYHCLLGLPFEAMNPTIILTTSATSPTTVSGSTSGDNNNMDLFIDDVEFVLYDEDSVTLFCHLYDTWK